MSAISVTTQTPEVAMIQANCAPVDGWQIHWLISRKQIEYLLTDIVALPPNAIQPHLPRAQYLEQSLPVITLEQHFGIPQLERHTSYRYLVTKFSAPESGMMRAILQIYHPVRMRKLIFNSVPSTSTATSKNERHILGAYTLPDNQLVIIPDIFGIVDQVE